MSEDWTKRTLLVDSFGKGVARSTSQGMTVGDAVAALARMKYDSDQIQKRIDRLEGKGRGQGSEDLPDPEFFIDVNRSKGAVGGSLQDREHSLEQPREDPKNRPEYLVPVDKVTGIVGE